MTFPPLPLLHRRPKWAALALACATLVACGSGGSSSDDPSGAGDTDNGFESDDPSLKSTDELGGSGGADAGASGAAESPSADGKGAGDANRAVEEADIIRQDGNRLYALSRTGGLAIVDITNPDKLRLLGRKRLDAMPFEMYVRDGRAYVMLNDFGHWVATADGWGGQWVTSSEIVSLDVTDATRIKELASYDVPGSIADSRIVGDALYLVTFEDGYCWHCTQKPTTMVTSFQVQGGTFKRVQQLPFTSEREGYSAWQRSVSATNQRLYIAGPSWSWNGQGESDSVVQVVDITDPGGRLVKGADVPIAGEINSRWQMDEHEGVLRVVSQFGSTFGSNSPKNPKVQTFTVQSASVITKLGETELTLPKPEGLRSVRFDGTRAYAITAERTDPLFTIDLSDPAAPKQKGVLEMPGWIFHMEPRGDRLVGFGFDDTQWGAGLQVSLFDVSDLEKPTMLKRVEFGSGSGNFAEDQDRIHKSLRVLDDDGMILVPFASYGSRRDGSCGKPVSGIQLIDYTRDDLVVRGVAPQYGMPRRALLANGRLLGVSDRSVTSFDITAKDAPKKKSEIDLANPANRLTRIGNSIATITNDWWTGEATLALTPAGKPDDASVSGKLALGALSPEMSASCSWGVGSWANWYSARLFPVGDKLVVTVPLSTYTNTTRGGKLIVGVVDVKNPAAPKLVGKTTIQLTERSNESYWGYGWWGFWDGYDYYGYASSMVGALAGSGDGIVQVGSKLAYLEVDVEYERTELAQEPGDAYYGPRYRVTPHYHRKIHVIDAASGANPSVAPAVALPDSDGAAPLHLLGSTVLTSRWNRGSSPGKVRFYVDRVDIGGAAPTRLRGLNVPGSLIAVDAAAKRIVTVDYKRSVRPANDWNECQHGPDGAPSRFDYDAKECITVARDFKLVDVDGTRATLRDTFTPPAQNLGGILVSSDRIYVTRHAIYDWNNYRYDSSTPPKMLREGGLWAIGGIAAGKLSIVSELKGDMNWPLAADGPRVALYTPGGVAIADTTSATPRILAKSELRGWGYASHVLFDGNRAVCSLGDWGMQTIALK